MRISHISGAIGLGLCIIQAGCIEKVPSGTAGSPAASDAPYAGTASSSSSPEANNGRIVPPAPTSASGAGSAPSGGGAAATNPELDKRVSGLESLLKSSPGDAKIKKELADAYYQQGEAIMNDGKLPPRMKYRPALMLFNRALSLDPNHSGAARNKATIEAIYKQMGMPIPQ